MNVLRIAIKLHRDSHGARGFQKILCVDGTPLSSMKSSRMELDEAWLDFPVLVRSTAVSGCLPMFVMGCGIMGCCDSGDVIVEHRDTEVQWTFVEDPALLFCFQRHAYVDEVNRVVSVDARLAALGSPSLVKAAACGDVELMNVLLEAGVDVDGVEDGVTALHAAAEAGRYGAVQRLLDVGANIRVRDEEFQRTALHLAAREGHVTVAQCLLSAGVKPNVVDRWGWTALDHVLWEHETSEMAALLLQHGAHAARSDSQRQADRLGG